MSDLDDKTVARFWAKVNRDGPTHPVLGTPCWLWTRFTHRGYGRFGIGKTRADRAHKVAWRLLRGVIPAGLQLDHLCRIRRCVNPAHLEPVSRRENILRGESPSARNARKTHCPQGHKLVIDGAGRRCIECRRRHGREYQARKRKARAGGMFNT